MKKLYLMKQVIVISFIFMIFFSYNGTCFRYIDKTIVDVYRDNTLNCYFTNEALLPVWVVGDSWTNHVNNFDLDVTVLSQIVSITNGEIDNIVTSINNIQNDIYTITFSSSNVDGYGET